MCLKALQSCCSGAVRCVLWTWRVSPGFGADDPRFLAAAAGGAGRFCVSSRLLLCLWFGLNTKTQERAKGAKIVREPNDTVYEMREFEVRDPDGHLLCFAHDISGQAAKREG